MAEIVSRKQIENYLEIETPRLEEKQEELEVLIISKEQISGKLALYESFAPALFKANDPVFAFEAEKKWLEFEKASQIAALTMAKRKTDRSLEKAEKEVERLKMRIELTKAGKPQWDMSNAEVEAEFKKL